MDSIPKTRTEKKGRDKDKSHGTPYSAKHARAVEARVAPVRVAATVSTAVSTASISNTGKQKKK
jgi:hypothetical protein